MNYPITSPTGEDLCAGAGGAWGAAAAKGEHSQATKLKRHAMFYLGR